MVRGHSRGTTLSAHTENPGRSQAFGEYQSATPLVRRPQPQFATTGHSDMPPIARPLPTPSPLNSNPMKNSKKPGAKRDWKKICVRVLLGGFVFGLLVLLGLLGYAWSISKDLPDVNGIKNRPFIESTKIFDRTGQVLLYDIHGEEKRTVLASADIPDVMRQAMLALEDHNFYSHIGFEPRGVARAVMANVFGIGVAQGGSTITQQFVKNFLLTNERTYTRKIKELILSLEMESKFTKDEILTLYLNEIPFGSNAYGVEAAANTFFDKHAKDLSSDEACLLASLPKGPTLYSPYGSRTDRLLTRQQYCLSQMADLGYLTPESRDAAIAVDVLGKIKPSKEQINAPHFVMYIKELLLKDYGEERLMQGGLKVTTTLDWEKQKKAEEIVKTGAENNVKYKAENAALLAIDVPTGQIQAMVGSKDYFSTEIDGQVNVVLSNRQPGSSFKPFVYLLAFARGLNPESIVYDTPTDFEPGAAGEYKPNNYDGKFHGPMKLKEALAQSMNIPAVKMLAIVGVKDAIGFARSLGIQTLENVDSFGLALVLGGGEVKLLDHTNAYATIARGGVRKESVAILKIEDQGGAVLQEYKPSEGTRVVEEKYVGMLEHAMSTNDYRAPVFGAKSPLASADHPLAAKTGTTNEFRDGWTMGFTPTLAVGVWAGNNDNTAMKAGSDGVLVAAPIWRAYMDMALKDTPVQEFIKYDKDETLKDIKKPLVNGELDEEKDVKVCEIPGDKGDYCLASSACPDSKVKKKDFVNIHDLLYYIDPANILGDKPEKPKDNPQYENWEEGVKAWYKDKDNAPKSSKILDNVPEDECKDSDFEKYKPKVELKISQSGASLSLSAKVDAEFGLDKVEYKVDGDDTGESYTFDGLPTGDSHTVTIKITDKKGNTATDSKSVTY